MIVVDAVLCFLPLFDVVVIDIAFQIIKERLRQPESFCIEQHQINLHLMIHQKICESADSSCQGDVMRESIGTCRHQGKGDGPAS